MGLGDYEKVIYHVKKALNSKTQELTGRNRLYRNLINAMRNLKYPDEEILKVIDEAIKNLPQLPEFYAERALNLCDINNLEDAYFSFKKSLEVWKNMPINTHENSYFPRLIDIVYAQLAELEAVLGNYKEAQFNLKEAIKYAPTKEFYHKRLEEFKKMVR